MTVKDIMSKDVGVCAPAADLAAAARVMSERDCGFLPVVDAHGQVVGVVTDRDICKTAAGSARALGHIAVSEAMSRPVVACFADENPKAVLATMGKHQVRRLPVLDKTGHLQGVVSIDDAVLASGRRGAPTGDEVVSALKGICTRRIVAA